MKTAGIVLIVLGIVMIIFRGISVPTEKKIIDAGPVQISKRENNWIGWPTYAGAVVAVLGVIMVVNGSRKAV